MPVSAKQLFLWATGGGRQLPKDEQYLHSWFSMSFFLIVGTNWIVIPVKNGIFVSLVGLENEPTAKFGTLFILIPVVFLYNYLLGALQSPRNLTGIIIYSYVVFFSLISIILLFPEFDVDANSGEYVKVSGRAQTIGWITYWVIETFSTICVAFTWSLATAYVNKYYAKIIFPVFIICSQVGAVLGSSLVTLYVSEIGFSAMFALSAIILGTVHVMLNRAFALYDSLQIQRDMLERQYELEALESGNLRDGGVEIISSPSPLSPQSSISTSTNCPSLSPAPNSPTRCSALLANVADISEGDIRNIKNMSNQSGDASSRESDNSSTTMSLACNSNMSNHTDQSDMSRTMLSLDGGLVPTSQENSREIKSGAFVNKKSKQTSTGLMEGLKLIVTRQYVLGLLIISTFPACCCSVFSFQMKVLAKEIYTDPAAFSKFLGFFGQVANFTGMLCALLGTKALINTLGLLGILTAMPVGALVLAWSFSQYRVLWVAFGATVFMKTFLFSINKPAKEMLFIRTSADVQFKAKSWIDMFGARGAKAAASMINLVYVNYPEMFLTFGQAGIGGALVFWLFCARRLGLAHRHLEATNGMIA